MFPGGGGGGNDEEIRYTIALEGAAQAGEDFEKLIAKAKEFNTEVATAIQLIKELMEQFSGKGGAQPQLPEFQTAFTNQIEAQSNVSLSAWQKAVEEITKMNQGVKTYSDYIVTMTTSLMAAEQASKTFGAEIDREAAKVQNLGTQTADTIAKLQQLGQQLGTGVPELKTPQPAEVVQPQIETENLERTAGQVEQLAQAETNLANATQQVAQPMAQAQQTTKGMGDETQNATAKLLTFDEMVAQVKVKVEELAKTYGISSQQFSQQFANAQVASPFPAEVWEKALTDIQRVTTATQTLTGAAEQLPLPFEQVDAATTKFGADTSATTAKVSQFDQQVQALIPQIQALLTQFTQSPGQAKLPDFQQSFEALKQQSATLLPGVWDKAVEEVSKLNEASRQYLTTAQQMSQPISAGTEVVKTETTAVQGLTAGLGALDEQAKSVKTDVVDLNKQLETTTPKAIEAPAQVVPAVAVPTETVAATTAVDNLVKEENKLATASQQLVQPLEQVNQASKDAQSGSQNLTDGLKTLDNQAKATKQGVQDLNKAIESQPEKVAVAPEVVKPAITNVPTQAVASLDALDQEQQKVKTSADALAQSEVAAGQAAQNMGTQAASAGSGGVASFEEQVNQAKTAIQALMDKFGGGKFSTEVAAQFEVAKIKSPLDPAAWDQALAQLTTYKTIAPQAASATQTLIQPMNQADQAATQFETDVQNLTNQLMVLASQGKTAGDFAATFGQAMNVQYSPDVIVEAFNRAKQAGVDFTTTVANGMKEDQIEISRAKEALRELAAIKMTSPLKAAEMPEFQALNFNPATVTAAMTDLGTSFDKTAVRKDAFKVNLQTLWAAFKQGETPIQGIKNAFSLLVQGFSTGGGVINAVIGGVLGFSLVGIVSRAVNSIGQFIQSLNQAAEASLAFLDATFKLEIGLRDAQRKGFDATRDELVQFSKDFKEKYPMFSNVAIRKGLADMIFFTKELGVSAKDSFAMFDSSASLASATGRDVSEVMRMIALAASSGYSEGLQRMGLNINKVTITERAHAMGIKETYMAMAQEDRAAALLNLVLEQTAGISKDAAEKQKTLAGWVATVAAKQEDAATKLGKAWLPFKTFFDTLKVALEQRLAEILSDITAWVANMLGQTMGLVNVMEKVFSGELFKGDIAKNIKDAWQSGMDEAASFMGTKEFYFDAKAQLDVELQTVGLDEEQKQKVYDATDKFLEDLEKSITDYQDGQVEAAEKYQEDLAKIEEDGLEKRAQLAEDYAQKQRDIEFNLQQDIEKAKLDLQRSLADIDLKALQDTQKAKEDAKQKELDLEKEYADKVAKLQRDLEFDLEEAVRARDATAVRRLKRQYGKDLTELSIQKQQDKAQIQHDLQLRLQEIQQRRALDIQQRQIDFAQKMADLQAQAALERQQALENYNKDLVDLQKSLAQQRNERKKAYNDQLKDLFDAFNKRLKMASEALAKEVGMNAQAAQAVASYLIALYGPNGVFQKVYDWMIAYIEHGKSNIIANFNPNNLGLSQQAEGGDYLVKHPTLFLAGEKGAEEAHFWPVNKPVPMPLASTGKTSSEQYLRVMVDLGPDLVGKIVDKSLDEFADVLVRSG